MCKAAHIIVMVLYCVMSDRDEKVHSILRNVHTVLVWFFRFW